MNEPIKEAQRMKYSFKKILTGSDLSTRRLAMMEAASPNPGPLVWLTACVHGDEVGGMVVIQEIFKTLKKSPLLKGEVNAFPLMNPIGFETISRNIGIGKEDLNRAFPGSMTGSLAERIAYKIFSTITDTEPTLVLDLHNDWIKSIPYAPIDPNPGLDYKDVFEKIKEFSKSIGLVLINEEVTESAYRISRKTLSGSLMMHHIPAITLELGEAFVVNENNVQDGVTAIWNVLSGLEMVVPAQRRMNHHLPGAIRDKNMRYSHQPVS
ncbi:succinylglutamate desuccinylase/aspartoacylase family protein, partial [bacterium]|nr:succinylglutamate desuccinylase/aspartoacylase family protein [bacterium]